MQVQNCTLAANLTKLINYLNKQFTVFFIVRKKQASPFF